MLKRLQTHELVAPGLRQIKKQEVEIPKRENENV
jgi:hypothetical protein